MLANVTEPTVGEAVAVTRSQELVFEVSLTGDGAVSAEYDIQVRNDGTTWLSAGDGTITGTDSVTTRFVMNAGAYAMRAVCRSISGTDAALTVRVPAMTLGDAAVADTLLNVTLGASALADDATDGFPYIPIVADTPSGEPTAKTGFAPICVDADGTKLWVYVDDAWKFTTIAAPE
jgi:hypothetical protein